MRVAGGRGDGRLVVVGIGYMCSEVGAILSVERGGRLGLMPLPPRPLPTLPRPPRPLSPRPGRTRRAARSKAHPPAGTGPHRLYSWRNAN
jgi:hypothetical protein